jgi:hypothetical protein
MQIPVKSIVNDEIRSLGFSRHGATWYRDVGEVIHVVGLQKSSWGSSYYVNLAIWIKAWSWDDVPKPSQCPLQCRVEAVPDTPDQLENALNEEDYWRMDAEQRRDIIKLALCNAEFMFFRYLKTLNDVKKFVAETTWPQLAVDKELSSLIRRQP